MREINSNVWGMAVSEYGAVVTGITCIRQRIDIAIRTTKGSDPCRPLFGSDVYKYADAPVLTAIPNIKKSIIEAVGLWVPDVKIISITHLLNDASHTTFFITYQLLNTDIVDSVTIDTGGGTIAGKSTGLILQALIPVNPDNGRFTVEMRLNGAAVQPLSNVFGFSTMNDLLTWVNENWGYSASFVLTETKLIAYISDLNAATGSLELAATGAQKISSLFPDLLSGESYKVAFDSQTGEMRMLEGSFTSTGEVLTAVQAQWADMGTFATEVLAGDFSGDFGFDFFSGGTFLLLYTAKYPGAIITITKGP